MPYVALILLLTLSDQLIKVAARRYLPTDHVVEVIPHFIGLIYQENRGISFSLLSELPETLRQPVLAGVSALVVVALSVYLWRRWERVPTLERYGFAMILSGALGNLIDRAFRGSVTDYMYFHAYQTGFFVNNFADDLISIGFVLVLWQSFKKPHGPA
ncbi:MAG: signal peptidase II [bacterium]|nr:signal peptidase II [bacterium]